MIYAMIQTDFIIGRSARMSSGMLSFSAFFENCDGFLRLRTGTPQKNTAATADKRGFDGKPLYNSYTPALTRGHPT